MRASEMSGTIRIGNLTMPATAHIEYADEIANAEQLKSFNEQLRRLRDMEVTITYELTCSAGTDPIWFSRLYTEIAQERRHDRQYRKLARVLAHKPHRYRVPYRARTTHRRRGRIDKG